MDLVENPKFTSDTTIETNEDWPEAEGWLVEASSILTDDSHWLDEYGMRTPAFRAFNKTNTDPRDSWHSKVDASVPFGTIERTGDGLPEWVSITYPRDTIVLKEYTIQARAPLDPGPQHSGGFPTSFKVQGFDGSNWVELDAQSGLTWTYGEKKSFSLPNNTIPYSKYRLFITESAHGGSTPATYNNAWTVVGQWVLKTEEYNPTFRFSESAMNPADGFLPYTPDSYDEDATQFNVTHDGKRYVVRTNSYSPGNHALTLFIDPTNNPGLTYWAAQVQKSSEAFYYKGFEGTMVVGKGDWAEIQYPQARTMSQYTLHFNLMTTAGNFVDVLDVPPTGWVVLGSNDGVKWEVLHESNVGKSGWMKSEWSDFSDIRDGAITQTVGNSQPFTHFRLLVTRWGDDLPAGDTTTLRRLDRWVLGTGTTNNAPAPDSNGPAASPTTASSSSTAPPSAPSPPPTPAPTGNNASNFLSDYKWYLLAAVLVVVALIMFM